MDNWESSVNLTWCLWTGGGSWSTQREPMQARGRIHGVYHCEVTVQHCCETNLASIRKMIKIMLMLTIIKTKLRYCTFSNWNWNSYAAINTLKTQILTFCDQLAWPKQGDNPSSTWEVGKHWCLKFSSYYRTNQVFC